ncbi:capsular exopolysaccharide family domain protein [Synechococcus sp. PROS-7-1]|uniref:GumC family protein n=1 Tax=Synechococcus sp. PROS-7-1 TaxID=1442556 RepID=UPI0016487E5B|nr:Wzz/FepE/Etk N-terminal domain-containing protein [Synechococcus sp. PROS-7-1]QNI84109.1 capsular exopolysaccharide family domain protein [Synechococcus sp. PROS-7-1]
MSTTNFDDEIDLRQVAGALLRHKRLIAAVAGASVVLSGIYAFTRKPVWEGQFQIVLQNNESAASGRLAQLAASNPMLACLAGLGGGSSSSSLETEVKILESPSVLKPVFDFVKKQKTEAGENVKELTFTDWLKENLSVELEKGTSVLNIAYRDTEQALVLPVIGRMSKAYQQYSGRDRSRDLTQGVAYLEHQLAKLLPQADASMRAAQNYALTNGLGLQDGIGTIAAAAGAGGSSANPSVEASREAAQNKVNALQQQLASARAAGGNRLYVAPQLEANADLYSKLQNLDAELQQKSALLRPNDPTIQALQRQRRSLTLVINQQTVGLLQGQLQTAQAQLASLSRPREVILKHRELVRTALRDEKTVAELETQLQTLQLEKARQTDPWELISTPTLLDRPVAPRKKRIVALGLLAGLVLGSGAALVVDRRTGLVFSIEELQGLLPCPLLKHLPALAPAAWSDAADLLAAGPLAAAAGTGPIALIPVGALPSDQLQAFSAELRRALAGRELLVSTDLRQTSTCVTQLLLTAPGVATRTQLSQLGQKLALQGTPMAGWVLLDPALELG